MDDKRKNENRPFITIALSVIDYVFSHVEQNVSQATNDRAGM